MSEATVTYVRKGPVVVLKNSGQLPLAFGEAVYRDTRWVVTADVFETLKGQNGHVTFVEEQRAVL